MTKSKRAAELARLAIPSDGHLCPACKLRPRQWKSEFCPECWWLRFVQQFESVRLDDTIREFRDLNKGG